ncbi:MAG: hypothetical protein ACREIF_09990 [Chthoniobacterales bacterium]
MRTYIDHFNAVHLQWSHPFLAHCRRFSSSLGAVASLFAGTHFAAPANLQSKHPIANSRRHER